MTDPVCPRCGRPAEAAADSGWECGIHGRVTPLQPYEQPNADVLGYLAARSKTPIWLPWPLPLGWVVTGAGHAGCERTGVRATVLACSGPDPLGGGGDLLIVAEEIGVGLGARYAAITGPDPGHTVGRGVPQARVDADGHPTSLWHVPSSPDRAVYAGAAAGLWLWLVFFPDTASVLLMESLQLADARLLGREVDLLPYGSLTPLLGTPD